MNSSNNNHGAPATTSPQITTGAATIIEIPNASADNTRVLTATGERSAPNVSMDDSSAASGVNNFLSLFARSHLGRQTSMPNQERFVEQPLFSGARGGREPQSLSRTNSEASPFGASSSIAPANNPHGRHTRSTWRMNLNNVLSFSSSPSTETLRSLISHSGNFRYTALGTSEVAANVADNIHLLLHHDGQDALSEMPSENHRHAGASRSNSLYDVGPGDSSNGAANITQTSETPAQQVLLEAGLHSTASQQNDGTRPTVMRQQSANRIGAETTHRAQPTTNAELDEENNVISEMTVQILSHFVRYLPFICILFIKFVHDHCLGIFDLLVLQAIMFQINKSLREQIAKFSQKSYGTLMRDFGVVVFAVAFRFALASATPDPLGLLIRPSMTTVFEFSYPTKATFRESIKEHENVKDILDNVNDISAKTQSDPSLGIVTLTDSVSVPKSVSLGFLLYCVAVNDLILKLITVLVKIIVTLLPTKVIRHKPRARMYVLIEYISQFYRSVAPVHQWLLFMFESYSGQEVFAGILFASLYIVAKGFEFAERGKSLKRSLLNFIRNMGYERKPTKDELDAVGSVCPICHDAFNTPVVLNCSHIFCDDCVSTWFKREQTCPMCRAKVNEDPTWQDGSTTFFYQLC